MIAPWKEIEMKHRRRPPGVYDLSPRCHVGHAHSFFRNNPELPCRAPRPEARRTSLEFTFRRDDPALVRDGSAPAAATFAFPATFGLYLHRRAHRQRDDVSYSALPAHAFSPKTRASTSSLTA